jgi:hypothetical protein
MFEFKHPKYYKNLRAAARAAPLSIRPPARNTGQAISRDASTEDNCVRPGPGLKQRDSTGGVPGEADISVTSDKPQATSSKPQASSTKLIKK